MIVPTKDSQVIAINAPQLLRLAHHGSVKAIICFIYLQHRLIVDVFVARASLSTSYIVEVWMSVLANPLNHKLFESVKSPFRRSLMFIGYSEVNAICVLALQEAWRGNNLWSLDVDGWITFWRDIFVIGESVRIKRANGLCQRKL